MEKDILKNKKIIAKFMGLRYVIIGYSGTKSETPFQRKYNDWMYANDMNSVGSYFINIEKNYWVSVDEVDYLEWGQLMPVVEEISRHYKYFPREVSKISRELTILSSKETVYDHVLAFCEWCNQQPKIL